MDVNCTVWWPYADMPGNLPGSGVRWLAGGGFELTAVNNGVKHACMNIWHRKHVPDGDCTFTFYATLLDALTSADATGEGHLRAVPGPPEGRRGLRRRPERLGPGQLPRERHLHHAGLAT